MGVVLVAAFVLIAIGGALTSDNPGATFAWLKTTPRPAEPTIAEEPLPLEPEVRQVLVERGDTLSGLLIDAGAEATDAQAAVMALSQVYEPSKLRAGQSVTLTFAPQTAALVSVALKPSVERDVAAHRADDGTFMAEEVVKQLTATDTRASGTIDGSLYLSAKAAGIPEAIIVDMIRIYSYAVDFQREIRPGDKFDVLYTHYVDETGESLKAGAIQYAELTLKGQKKPLYRFTTSDDQSTDYYDPKGWSGKRMLMRTPIDGARLTSGFGMRHHPILGYTKMHKGVDFGASTGTPVMAAGSGVIEKAEWYGGYGRYVRIKHGDSYSTGYAHLSRFARGIEKGKRVRQGQIIAYVGTTGRSTGPHLHYEVMIMNKQVNPLGVKIPTGRNLAGKDLKTFKDEMARVAHMLETLPAQPALVARHDGGVIAAAQAAP